MLRIGIDTVNLTHMAETIQRSGNVFLNRVFSHREISRAKACETPVLYYASTFAAKEAVFKALTLTWQAGVDLRDIEISRGPLGEPLVTLSGAVGENVSSKGNYEVALSITYETNIVIAMVVLFKETISTFH